MLDQIGKRVSYIRTLNGTIEEGEAIMIGQSVDYRGRLVAHLKKGPDQINVEAAAVNPSADMKQKFRDLITQVTQIEQQAKEENSAMVKKYNAQIDEAYDIALGKRPEMEEITDQPEVAMDEKPKPVDGDESLNQTEGPEVENEKEIDPNTQGPAKKSKKA